METQIYAIVLSFFSTIPTSLPNKKRKKAHKTVSKGFGTLQPRELKQKPEAKKVLPLLKERSILEFF